MLTTERPKNPHAVALGKLGGAKGKGAAKRQTPEHYAKMAAVRRQQAERARAIEGVAKYAVDLLGRFPDIGEDEVADLVRDLKVALAPVGGV